MLRTLLVFLAGLLLGANLVYFAMHRGSSQSSSPPAPTTAANPSAPGNAPATGTIPATPAAASKAPTAATPASMHAPARSAEPGAIGPTGLLLPVQGVRPQQLVDTFSDARSEGRVHDAIDIMAPAGTPVLAVADGTVEKLFTSKRGGLTLYQFNPERTQAWYYAHLQRYAAGIVEKKTLKRGEVIGYVGATGNASPDAPHLHFAIFLLGPEKQWWKGEAINPYPLLGGTPR